MAKGVWFAELDRFGYMLQVVAESEQDAANAMQKEYIKGYKDFNDGASPSASEKRMASEDTNITFMSFKKVEWT